MVDFADELAWEQEMVDRGVSRFMDNQAEARSSGRGDESSAGATLIRAYIGSIAEAVEDYVNAPNVPGTKTRPSSDRQLMAQVEPHVIAMISIKAIMAELHNPQQTMASTAYNIGARIEQELTLRNFHAEYGTYFEEILRKIDKKQSYSMEYKYNSITGSMRNTKGITTDPWERTTRYKIGMRLIQIVLDSCDLFELEQKNTRSKQGGGSYIRPTKECMEWISKHDDNVALAFPDRMPMLIPPAPWENPKDGGYILPHLRKMTPLVIRSPLATLNSDKYLEVYDVPMPKVYSAGNTMQRTAWQINVKVLEVLQEVLHRNLGFGVPPSEPYEFPKCPLAANVKPKDLPEDSPERGEFNTWRSEMRELHEKEADRKAKLFGALRILGMANKMQHHSEFYYVWRMDFRGRWYAATTGLSPQGSDLGKALLRFRKGKPHGKEGWDEFRVTGANRYGVDKVPYADRIKWVDDNSKMCIAIAGDPISNAELWTKASEPYGFLAWCFEYASSLAHPGGPEAALNFIPNGRDGSCNGLQHFSAMLRDEVGGRAVNLYPSDTPSDIYQSVADVMTEKLRDSLAHPDHAASANWISMFHSMGLKGAPRSLTKLPVMTLPYGSTERTCCDSIAAWYHENGNGYFPKATAFKHALYLTPLLWGSIGEVVIAARAAMAWIRTCTRMLAKEGHALYYVSSLGFPVRQVNTKHDLVRINTYLSGNMILRTQIAVPNNTLDSAKMQNSAPPNFVHNCDATHLAMSVNAMASDGVTAFAFVHDEFGTHSCDVKKMQRHIREQFVELYANHDPLQSFKDQLEQQSGIDLPDIPTKGSLDIQQVLQSPFFFS